MNHFSEMDWNSKWDWENFVAFGSKAVESPKKLQLADWMIVDDGETDAGCLNPCAAGGNSGASGSDCGHVSSAKSSISASTDSSIKDGMQGPNFRLMTFEGFTGNFGDKMEVKGVEGSRKEVSVGSVEPLIGLKLGKRTYFENSNAGGTGKSATFSVMPTPPSGAVTLKKNKPGAQNLPAPHCLVEGCNVDLSTAKEYHRKHRVCDTHSKSPKVIVGGLERRFCQQCSRFHGLAEFDEKKRSCRRRLSDHNARRRKPPQETMQFNSTSLSSTFYEGRQQMSFLLSNTPYAHSRNLDNTLWNNSLCNSKFTITKGYSPKYNVDESTGGHMHMPGIKQLNIINMQDNPPNGFLASKSPMAETLSPGSKCSLFSPNLDAAPEYRRALSLLSTNSWGSCGPESMPVHPLVHETGSTCVTQQPSMQAIPEGVPLSSSDFWLTGHQLTHPRPHPLPSSSSSNFPETQPFKTPYETDFYSNILN